MTHRLLNRAITPAMPLSWPNQLPKSATFLNTSSSYMSFTHTESQRRKFLVSVWMRFFRIMDNSSERHPIWGSHVNGNNDFGAFYIVDKTLRFHERTSGSTRGSVYAQLNGVDLHITDTSWYHFVFSLDSDNATADDRLWWWINGIFLDRRADNSINSGDLDFGVSGAPMYLGVQPSSNGVYLDGYIHDVRILPGVCIQDGVWDISDFGQFIGNHWSAAPIDYPKLVTAGADACHLDFMGSLPTEDRSPNGNDWSSSGTVPLRNEAPSRAINTIHHSHALVDANILFHRTYMRRIDGQTSSSTYPDGSVAYDPRLTDRGFYYEIEFSTVTSTTSRIGIRNALSQVLWWRADGATAMLGGVTIGTGFVAGNRVGMFIDIENWRVKFRVDGVDQGSGWYNITSTWNRDQPFCIQCLGGSTVRGTLYHGTRESIESALPTADLEAINCRDNTECVLSNYNAGSPPVLPEHGYWEVEYTGDGTTSNPITGCPFPCDQDDVMIWIKRTDVAGETYIYSNVIGTGKRLLLSQGYAVTNAAEDVKSFDREGFTVGSNAAINASGGNFLAHVFRMTAEYGRAILKQTGTGVARNIAHGLGRTPEMVLVKNLDDGTQNWHMYHRFMDASAPEGYYMLLNATGTPVANTTAWDDTYPDSTNFRVGTKYATNKSGDEHLYIIMTGAPGLSHFGQVTGNGSTNDKHVPLGFEPGFLFRVNRSATGSRVVAPGLVRNRLNPVHNYYGIDNTAALASTEFTQFNAMGYKRHYIASTTEIITWTIARNTALRSLGR